MLLTVTQARSRLALLYRQEQFSSEAELRAAREDLAVAKVAQRITELQNPVRGEQGRALINMVLQRTAEDREAVLRALLAS